MRSKHYLSTLTYLLTLLFLSCKSTVPLRSSDTERRDSVIIVQERLVPVALPADSATVRALLECDKNGKIALKWLDVANTENVQLQFTVDSLGNLLSNFVEGVDTVYIPSTSTEIKSSVNSDHFVTVEVERQLSRWQRFCIYFTSVILSVAAIYIILFIRSTFKKIF